MDLLVQFQVLIVSFVYGIMLSYIVKLQYKYMFIGKLWYKIIFNIVFMIDIVLLYFLMLRLIDDGIFHIYFLFLIVLGYVLGNSLINKN